MRVYIIILEYVHDNLVCSIVFGRSDAKTSLIVSLFFSFAPVLFIAFVTFSKYLPIRSEQRLLYSPFPEYCPASTMILYTKYYVGQSFVLA